MTAFPLWPQTGISHYVGFHHAGSLRVTTSICLFNHKGGVSKTTTTFNLGWSLAERGHRVLMVDLDSQCNLTGLVLGYRAINDEQMGAFYQSRQNLTMKPVVDALVSGVAPTDFMRADAGQLLDTENQNLLLLPGHLDTAELDAQISVSLKIASGVPVTRNIPGHLPAILHQIAQQHNVDVLLYDLSPNVGGLNEVILMSSDFFIVPTSPDYFCLQAVGSLRKHILKWHREIRRFREDNGFENRAFPIHNAPKFIGAVQQRYRPRLERPAMSFQSWIDRIRDAMNSDLVPALETIGCVLPRDRVSAVLGENGLEPYDLAHVADFNSLIAISQKLSKPVFALTDADIRNTGRVFGHAEDTMVASRDHFRAVFSELAERVERLTLSDKSV